MHRCHGHSPESFGACVGARAALLTVQNYLNTICGLIAPAHELGQGPLHASLLRVRDVAVQLCVVSNRLVDVLVCSRSIEAN